MTSPSSTAPGGEWQALHVFYAASPRPLLLECVKPLVDELTAEGLLAGHFFINYWLEGPHVRLRLKPAGPEAAEEVSRRSQEAVAAFLRRRPALYEVKNTYFADLYNTLFDLEFPGEQRDRLLGPDGKMRLRPNNSFSVEPYEPEYGKYGGVHGVELAEWHFQHSSDLVVEALRTMNLHLRTVLLGISAQLMMVMSACFLRGRGGVGRLPGALPRLLGRRVRRAPSSPPGDGYDRAYEQMGAELGRRFTEIRSVLVGGQGRAAAAASCAAGPSTAASCVDRVGTAGRGRASWCSVPGAATSAWWSPIRPGRCPCWSPRTCT